MKGKTKGQKGITLIALIITVVVLLILATVAISSIQNDGILGYAQNAAQKFNQAQVDEQGILEGYLNSIQGKLEIVNFGDSIFGNYRMDFGSEESISALISEMIGANCYNAGFGGCGMTAREDAYGAFSMCSLADSIVNNDWSAQENAITEANADSS